MEKYGVVIDAEKVKEASEKEPLPQDICPECGKEFFRVPGPWCKNCGVEPWAKKP